MGHSISGIYSLYWSQIYPNEIKGIIGIDPSVPKMTSKENNPFPVSVQLLNQISAYTQKIVNITGITRLLSINNPKKVVYADPQYLYSEKEWEVFRILTLDKGYNATVMTEMKNLEKKYGCSGGYEDSKRNTNIGICFKRELQDYATVGTTT